MPSEPSPRPTRSALLRWRPAVLMLATVVVATTGAVFHSRGGAVDATTSKHAVPTIAALTVTSAIVHSREWPQVIEANGSIAAWQEASVGTVVGGLRVSDVLVDVGDVVVRGQALAHFDVETVQAAQAALRADLSQARAVAARADAELARAQELHDGGAVSDQDLLQAKTQAATAHAQVAAAEAHLEAQDLQLKQAVIVAPDAGVITSRSVGLGAVEPAGQELFRLIRRSRLQWQGEVTAAQVSSVHSGQLVRIVLPDGTSATGHVSRIAPSMNAQTRLGVVFADIDTGGAARAGMFAAAQIELPPSPARVVPAVSVLVRDGRNVVAAIETGRDGPVVSIRRVTVGRRFGNEVEIIEGLSNGTRVVARGANFLDDGDLVKLSDADPKLGLEG
jgi:RND family efflux transporter MFP subunit